MKTTKTEISLEIILLVILSFVGVILITTGLNAVLPPFNPYIAIILGAIAIIFTGGILITRK